MKKQIEKADMPEFIKTRGMKGLRTLKDTFHQEYLTWVMLPKLSAQAR